VGASHRLTALGLAFGRGEEGAVHIWKITARLQSKFFGAHAFGVPWHWWAGMARFASFYPALLIFLGAVLVAGGGFWASWRQTNFNSQLREKNEEIVRLQTEQSELITGGDSLCYLVLVDIGNDARRFLFPHRGKFPLYDVEARIVEELGKESESELPTTLYGRFERSYQNIISLGNMAPESGRLSNTIQLAGRQQYGLNIFYTARNGSWSQMLRMRRTDKGWLSATKVTKGQGAEERELYRAVDEAFPRNPDREVDWGYGVWRRLPEEGPSK
jgi:hypothetical protein